MQELHALRDLLVLLGLGVVVVVAFSRARVPPIVGFLITGVLCGPYGLGFVRDVHQVEMLAEIGVILLLFTIGLEFSVQQLVRMRSFLLMGGGLQVGLTMSAVAALASIVLAPRVGIFLGMLVALSSTAIVVRLLAERRETDSPHGHATLGILIFQDLCIVPMMLAVPVLAGTSVGAAPVALMVAKAVGFVALAWVAARWVVPRILQLVVDTRRREVFVLTILLLCLGTAWASAQAGLSPALGAFLAGLMLSDSEYNHQALGEVLPMREVFNSIFFVSIGMLFDVRAAAATPVLVVALLLAVLAGKTLITTLVAWAVGQSLRVAVVTALGIAQIGEFSFILSKVGLEAGLVSPAQYQLFLAVAVGSMAATPLLLALAPRASRLAERCVPARLASGRAGRAFERPHGSGLTDHVIIVGYGLNGRNLARVLARVGIPFIVVEMNPDAVRAERRRGRPIIFGDAGRREVLEHAGIESARLMVVAISDAAATRASVELARRLNPTLHILVRSRYVQEIEPLMAIGTDEVVPEEFETSVEIFARVLRRYLVARDEIDRQVRAIREEGYEVLRATADVPRAGIPLPRILPDLALETYRVQSGAELAGARLDESGLRARFGVSVAAIQRADGTTIVIPGGGERLAPEDVVLLFGRQEGLLAARVAFGEVPPPAPIVDASGAEVVAGAPLT